MEWYYIVLIVIAGLYLFSLLSAIGLVNGVMGREKDHKAKKKAKNEAWQEYLNSADIIVNEFLARNPEKLTLDCSDGKKRRGYFLKNNASDVLIVFSHGWKSKGLINFGLTGKYALDNNYNILVVDHLGHGESETNHLGFGIKDYYALIEWCDLIIKKENKEYKIFLHGVSMGSNTCLLCADKEIKGFRGIIADCGFTNAWEQLCYSFKYKYHLPTFLVMDNAYLVCKIFLKMDLKKLSTLDTVSNSKVPIFYIHGEKDDFVPTYMTIENEKVTTVEHELWISKDCKHASTAFKYCDEYMERVNNFINKHK